MKEWRTVKRKSSDSRPTRPPAAAATAIDWGEIILPTTPPLTFAETVTTGSRPMALAVVACSLPKRALEEVSDPVINPPSQPRRGEKKGRGKPVAVKLCAIVRV